MPLQNPPSPDSPIFGTVLGAFFAPRLSFLHHLQGTILEISENSTVSLQTHGCFCPDLRSFDLGLHLASVLLASFLMIGESIIVYFNYEIYCYIMMVMVISIMVLYPTRLLAGSNARLLPKMSVSEYSYYCQ